MNTEQYSPCSSEDVTSEHNQAYSAYKASIWAYAFALTRNWADADEVVQETYLQLFKTLEKKGVPHNVPGWLHTAARRQFFMLLRRRRNLDAINFAGSFVKTGHDGDQTTIDPADNGLSPDEEMTGKETIQTVRECIDRLPEKNRQILLLTQFEGFTLGEAADTLDTAVDTLRSRLHRARELLREMLLQRDAFECTPSSS